MGKRWVPLESNPEVMNTFATKLGADLTHVAFAADKINVYADDWRVQGRAA